MLLGFKKQFAASILDGSKKHTLRVPRARKPKIGETLSMYEGLRTKDCELITKEHTLKSVQSVLIYLTKTDKSHPEMGAFYRLEIKIDDRSLSPDEINQFCINDGFKDKGELCTFLFKNIKSEQLQEEFELYHWTDLKY